ncbi:MAG: PKD domain-containing protein, partial [Mameliella sp.]|nr:PKD domain-containing protein [Phaeodactylibacter sp.]
EGTLTLSATGGNGGNANNNNSNQCFGPGGGGGGGYIRVPGSFDTNLLLQGGIPGLSINSSACAESPNGGTTGSAGLSGGPFIIPASTLALPQAPTVSVDQDTLSSCADALTLNAFPNGLYTELVWEMDTGNGFFPVPENATYSNPDAVTLTINNPAEASGVLFQLLVYSNCFEPTISSTIFVAPGTLPEASFTTEIDGLSVLFENTGTIGATYNWDFGDNSTGSGPAPNHSYVNAGIYTVTLSVTTDCGTSTTQQNITVGSAPAPDFGVEGSSTGCAPRSVSFLNQSTGTFDSLRWDFPGGTPASSTLPNPTITYESPGTFPVSITLFSAFGPQEFTIEEQVIMYTRPTAAFSYTIDGLTVTFTNLSTDATFYSWNFGDNTTSNETSPVHNFPGPGNYDVTLNASNPNCSRAATESIFLQPSSTEQSSHKGKIILSPNPASDQVCLLTNTPLFYPVIWRCYNANGQLVTDGVLNNNQSCISLEMLPAGLYYFKVNDEDRITVLPLMVR